MDSCRFCEEVIPAPIYNSRTQSLSTMLRGSEDPTVVYFCSLCGHLHTKLFGDIDSYYAEEYSILENSDEEDQLYQVIDGRQVYQIEHRLETFLKKVDLAPNARVLDFGCAKGAFLHRLTSIRPDIVPHYFEVTERYRHYWEKHSQPSQQAIGDPPEEWSGSFDAVCSFYVLEHVLAPEQKARLIRDLLKPGGKFYFIVPNVLANSADLVVADHLHHFCRNSIAQMLQRADLEVLDIDDSAHNSAYVVVAQKRPAERLLEVEFHDLTQLKHAYRQMATFWTELGDRIRAFESQHVGRPACVYGAGFYGSFIWSCLAEKSSIACFVDQNPYLHGQLRHGVPIVAPTNVDPTLDIMYVGLNPAAARSIIEGITSWPTPPRSVFYL